LFKIVTNCSDYTPHSPPRPWHRRRQWRRTWNSGGSRRLECGFWFCEIGQGRGL